MGAKNVLICLPSVKPAKIIKWKVDEGTIVYDGRVMLLYNVITKSGDGEHKKLKATEVGTVRKLLVKEGDVVDPGAALLELERGCSHPTVMNDLCAECGADLRKIELCGSKASVPMVHSVPDLKVSEEQAQILGRADEERLLKDRKLVLLVDLDQTLIHTTNDNIPNNLKDVYHFQLGPHSPWYHTRLRPGTHHFLCEMSQYYELHICTFGARNYAHTIAHFLDPDGKFFSQRILSRDECFNPNSKMANLKALFPCGDELVCIIDDREDVWNFAPNLIHVKPYHFFQHTGDIHAPPGLSKCENDEKEGFDFTQLAQGLPATDDGSEDKVKVVKILEDSSESELEEGELKASKNETTDKHNSELQENLGESKEDGETKGDGESKEDNCIESVNKSTEEEQNNIKTEEKELKSEGQQKDGQKQDAVLQVEEADDYLLYLEEILKKVHRLFYEIYDKNLKSNADLKKVIPEVRQQVLAGTKLVFTGMVPTHMSLEQSKAYCIARSLGAEVSQDLTQDTTHLIAVRAGTAKVNAARRMKDVKTVTPDWLWTCAERWERVEEALFPVGCERAGSRHPPPHCASPPHSIAHDTPAPRMRSPSGRFMDTINPLMSFSSKDIADMDAEVEDICNESDSEGEGKGQKRPATQNKLTDEESSSSSADSLSGEHVRGWGTKRPKMSPEYEEDEDDETVMAKFRRGEGIPSDIDFGEGSSVGSEDPPDEVSDGDWNMWGAALEREFLEGD